MGTPDFAVPCLQKLVDDGHDVVGVYTQPDKPKGRGYTLAPPPVKELALSLNIPVFQPTKLRDGTVLQEFKQLSPDLVVVVAYGRILPKELLDFPPCGCVNIHGSILPKYRGAAPIQWTVLNGDQLAGVTSMYMAEGLDTGDMILTLDTPVLPNETSSDLYLRLAPIGADCLSQTVTKIAQSGNGGKIPATPQDESLATLAPMLEKSMGELDFSKDAQHVHQLVQGLNSWPSASVVIASGKTLKIHRSVVVDQQGDVGEILDSKKFIVACGKNALELVEVQPQGKGKMAGGDFVRGARLEKGHNILK